MWSCYACSSAFPSTRCLTCQKYFCLACSGIHRQNHLLDSFEQRLSLKIDSIKSQFDGQLYKQYLHASDHLQSWMTEILRQFEHNIRYQLEQYIKDQFTLLKIKTDEYVEEYMQYFINLRSNVRYTKQRRTRCDYDQEILRLISIEKELLKQYHDYMLQFQLRTHEIDFTKYITVEKQFHESSIPISLEFAYELFQPSQTLRLESSVQHMVGSCLDLFIFMAEPLSTYPCLLEFSTSTISTNISLEHSIEFPNDIQIIDMRWSTDFDCLFLLTSASLHKYEKYERKIQANIMKISNSSDKWLRLTTNRFGIYILNEKNIIESYDKKISRYNIFNMNDHLSDMYLVYDLQGQANCLCILTLTKEKLWQVDLFSSRQLQLKRTLKLSATLRPPFSLTNAQQKNTWIIADRENSRLIVFDHRMKYVQHYSLASTPNYITILHDKTLVIASPDIPGAKLSFYSPKAVLPSRCSTKN